MTTVVPNLDYAPPVPPARRWRRRLTRWAVVGGVAVTLWVIGPSAYTVARYRYLQYQCGRYVAPPGAVVCVEPPRWGGIAPPFLIAAADPVCLWSLCSGQPVLTGSGPALFLHRRVTPGGRERLVLLRRVPPQLRESWDRPVAFRALTYEWEALPGLGPPVTYCGDPPTEGQPLPEIVPQVFRDDPTAAAVRFFAGQPDPDDPSHFTVEFEVDGQRGVIDGYVRDRADETEKVTVELKAR